MMERMLSSGQLVQAAVDPGAVRLDTIRKSGIPVTPIRFRFKFDIQAILAVRRIIFSFRPDIIHTFNKRALTNVLAASAGTASRIVGYRGIIGNIQPWNPESRLVFFNRRLLKIICVCRAVEESLNEAGISGDKTVTIYKGHDTSWYTPAARSRLAEWNIPEDAFVVGCAARMRPRKGVDVLVKSFSRLLDHNAHLLLAGEITDSRIVPMIESSGLAGRIHIAGFREDASSIMGACDTFVMPSLRREGLPRAAIEAMAQGVPPVMTNVGGMPELVHSGRDGIIVPPGDATAMANAIAGLIINPAKRKAMGMAAKQRIIDAFNINDTVSRTTELYDSIL